MNKPNLFLSRVNLNVMLALIAVLSFTLTLIEIFQNPDKYQWDLKVYFNAPLDLARGLNPYENTQFVYPPLTLNLFKIFPALFTYDQFYWLFLSFKIILFAALLVIWKKEFLRKTSIGLFSIFVCLGFYATFLLDFRAGNISVIETLLVFIAFCFYIRERYLVFSALIIICACFKITPIFFLALLIVGQREKHWKTFVFGCFLFILYGFANFIVYPSLAWDFVIQATSRTSESGFICPSSLSFLSALLNQSAEAFGFSFSKPLILSLYAFFACALLLISWKRLGNGLNAQTPKVTRTFSILFIVLVYVLIMPRMKDYAYMIAIASILFAIQEFKFKVPQWVLFLPMILIPPTTFWPILFQTTFNVFWTHYPLLLVGFFWKLYMDQLDRSAKSNSAE